MDLPTHIRIDTHRHLGGSLTTDFVWNSISALGLSFLAESYNDVVCQMTFLPDEEPGFHRFLKKFKILDEMPWTEALIDQSVQNVCAGLAAENVDYALLDFSINKYMRLGWHKRDAIKFIYESFEKHRPGRVGLILSIKYESMQASQRQYAKLIDDSDVAGMLAGIDLVGDEECFDVDVLAPLLGPWAEAGKLVRAHVGEFGPARNIHDAIVKMRVTNVAHGIKIITDPDLMALAKDSDVYFDLGMSSNVLTGVSNGAHPVTEMLNAGLKLTIGTDDPVICGTTLDGELQVALTHGVTQEQIRQMQANAVHSANRFELTRLALHRLL